MIGRGPSPPRAGAVLVAGLGLLAISGPLAHGAQGDAPPVAVAAEADPRTGALRPPAIPVSGRIGVAHIMPRYKPNGRLGPDILVSGARDALGLGFRTIKVGLNGQVLIPEWRYYDLPREMLRGVTNLVELADLGPYRQLFDLPFRTFFVAADPIGPGNVEDLCAHPPEGSPPVPDPPLSEEAKRNLYRQYHDLSKLLLTRYRGSGKIFVLQNHEGDWHTIQAMKDELIPTDTALENSRIAFDLKQQAVDDARREVGATGVYLYHMVEVNLVEKALRGGKGLTNDVLPRLHSDLVSYSSYETALAPGDRFIKALDYLRARANDSYAFGDDNVVIGEIGLTENNARAPFCEAIRSHAQALTARVPWIIQWTLYDNECFTMVGGHKQFIFDPDDAQCDGFWVRKPDGALGRFFRSYQPYLDDRDVLDPEPTDPGRYAGRLYRALLGREIDPAARASAVAMIEARPWDKDELFKDLILSPEYKDRTAGCPAPVLFDTYRVLLGRNPEPGIAVAMASANFPDDAARAAYVDSMLQTEEAGRRYVTWLFRRELGRRPNPEELATWVGRLQAERSRRAVFESFVSGLPRP